MHWAKLVFNPAKSHFFKPKIEMHQEKKSASGRTGCAQTHQAFGTL